MEREEEEEIEMSEDKRDVGESYNSDTLYIYSFICKFIVAYEHIHIDIKTHTIFIYQISCFGMGRIPCTHIHIFLIFVLNILAN